MPIHWDVSLKHEQRLAERVADALHRRIGVRGAFLRHGLHLRADGARGRAHVAQQLAPDQVERLDARRALVNREDADVAILLRDAGLLDVPHAAEDLQSGRA